MRRALFLLAAAAALAGLARAAPAEGRLVLEPTRFPGWRARQVFCPHVMPDPAGGYRMYFSGAGTEERGDAAWDLGMTGVATSRDGVAWSHPDSYEPVLAPTPFREGEWLDPARLAARFDSVSAVCPTVLHEGGSWHMWYEGWNGDEEAAGPGRSRRVHGRIGYAVSADGLRWTRRPGSAEGGAVLGLGPAGAPDSVSAGDPSIVREGGRLHLFYECSDGATWRLCQARSVDGIAWERAGAVAGTDGMRGALAVSRGAARELWARRADAAGAWHVVRARSADGASWGRFERVALHPRPALRRGDWLQVDAIVGRRAYYTHATSRNRPGPWGPLPVFERAIGMEALD